MGKKFVKWDITNRCNLRCAHCSVGKLYFSGEVPELCLEEKFEVVDKLAGGGVDGISILGGEPLVLRNELLAVAGRAVDKGLQVSLVSNGTLLFGSAMRNLLDLGLHHIVVSLEGASKESHEAVRGKGTFDRVVKNTRQLVRYVRDKDLATQVNINTVLNRNNQHELHEILELCLRLGVDEWTMLSLVGQGFAGDHLNGLEITPEEEIEGARKLAEWCTYAEGRNRLKVSPQVYPLVADYVEKVYGLKMPRPRICCNASISLGFVSPDGNLYPCDRILTEGYSGAKIGDAVLETKSLLSNTFYDVWNSDPYVNMFDLILQEDTYANYVPCNHCKYLRNRHCNPCPLYSLDSRVVVDSCILAERELGDISGGFDAEAAGFDTLELEAGSNGDGTDGEALFQRLSHGVPRKKSGIRTSVKGEGLVLLNPFTVKFIIFNLMGRAVWEAIDGRATVSDIAHEIGDVAEALRERLGEGGGGEVRPLIEQRLGAFFGRLDHLEFIDIADRSRQETVGTCGPIP